MVVAVAVAPAAVVVEEDGRRVDRQAKSRLRMDESAEVRIPGIVRAEVACTRAVVLANRNRDSASGTRRRCHIQRIVEEVVVVVHN